MRKRIYEIIEASTEGDTLSAVYDMIILASIVISLITLTFKTAGPVIRGIDKTVTVIFIIDYILRWMTADYKFSRHTLSSFIRYPFTFMALVDLISILPSLTLLSSTFKILRVFRLMKVLRMMRALRVFRIFKAARYSHSIEIIVQVFDESIDAMAAVGTLAILYIFVSALIVFNVEPDTFDSFFDAFYWATVSLTTVGYGDIYPVTVIGKIVAMISSVFGIAVVALPSGIITAGYLNKIQSQKEN